MADIEIDNSNISSSRRTSLALKEKRKELTQMKKQIARDITIIQSNYLNKQIKIRCEFDSRQKLSTTEKILNKSKTTTRTRNMQKLNDERNRVVGNYKNMEFVINNLINQIDDTDEYLKNNLKFLFNPRT